MTDLSVILPTYNEKNSIEQVLKEWSNVLERLSISYIFVVCEDGSTDGTKEILVKIKNKYPLILNQKKLRRGYGGAVIDGIKASNSKYILCIDSDGQCDASDFEKFWGSRKNADITIGYRKTRSDALQRLVFSGLFKSLFLILFPVSIHDPSAPYVLFKKSLLNKEKLRQLTYLSEGFWWGFVGMSKLNNLSLQEHEINHRSRMDGTTQVYKAKKLPSIAMRNIYGLIKLRISQ